MMIMFEMISIFFSSPFANVFSMADGPLGESSGTVSTMIMIAIMIFFTIFFIIFFMIFFMIFFTIIFTIFFLIFFMTRTIFQIYMYTTPLEISFKDLAVDSRASITLSLAQVITVIIIIARGSATTSN